MSDLLKFRAGGLKTPLARAKGLGSARSGVHHWVAVHTSFMAALPLVVWLLYSLINLQAADHATFVAWLAQPLNAVLMIATILSVTYYGWLETQLVIEDYIADEVFKVCTLWVGQLVLLGITLSGVFAVLKIALG